MARQNGNDDSEVMVQLATRIPKDLHKRLKIHCVTQGRSVMDFIQEATEAKLEQETGGSRVATGTRGRGKGRRAAE